MSEIKPVYQLRYGTGDVEVTEEQYFRESYMRGTPRRMLYHAAAYEALQKENAELQLRLDAKTLSHQLMLDRTLGLQKETAAQEKRIADLEETLNYYKNMVGA